MLKFKDHLVNVPLNYERPNGKSIELFAREFYSNSTKNADIFVFLQGGPGFGSPHSEKSVNWITELGKKFRVLLVDQRGTGRSQPLDSLSLKGKSENDLMEIFVSHRQEGIIQDLEHLREYVFKVKKWFLIGQSYGGFLTFHYLSFYPDSIKGALVFGGIPPLHSKSLSSIYERLVKQVLKRNLEYYRQYPRDREKVKRIADCLAEKPIRLADGGRLTFERFQYLGLQGLGFTNGFETIHGIVDGPFQSSKSKKFNNLFIKELTASTWFFETNPIYAVLHESIYCNGIKSGWAAEEVLKGTDKFTSDNSRINFVGEQIRKSIFKDMIDLKPFYNVAKRLAQKRSWGHLYDLETLEKCRVPVECLIYEQDVYVDFQLSLQAIQSLPTIKKTVHPWWCHNALGHYGAEALNVTLPKLLKRIR